MRSIPADCLRSVIVGQKRNRHTKINIQIAQIERIGEEEVIDFLTTPKKRTFDSQLPSD